jgi:hypothetical protein
MGRAETKKEADERRAFYAQLIHEPKHSEQAFGSKKDITVTTNGVTTSSAIMTRPVLSRGKLSQASFYGTYFSRDESSDPSKLHCRLPRYSMDLKKKHIVVGICTSVISQTTPREVFSNAVTHIANSHPEYLALEELATHGIHPLHLTSGAGSLSMVRHQARNNSNTAFCFICSAARLLNSADLNSL